MELYLAQSKIGVSEKLDIILLLLLIRAIPRLGMSSPARVLTTDLVKMINAMLPV